MAINFFILFETIYQTMGMNPFENTFIQMLSGCMVTFGLIVAGCGVWSMFKRGNLGPTDTVIDKNGMKISSANPGFYAFVFGLMFTSMTFYLLVSGKESFKVVSSWFISSAYADNHQSATGWSYLGDGNNKASWNYTFLGDSLKNFSQKKPGVIVQANKRMPVRARAFNVLSGVFIAEPEILGHLNQKTCASVSKHKSVGLGKIWLHLSPVDCPE